MIDPLRVPASTGILAVKILVALAARGPMNLTALAGLCGVSTGALSVSVHRLGQKGLVHRIHHPRDRRHVLFDVGPEGRDLVADWTSAPVALPS